MGASDNRFQVRAMEFACREHDNAGTPVPILVGGLTSQSEETGNVISTPQTGFIYDIVQSISQYQPMETFTSEMLAIILKTIQGARQTGLQGLCVDSSTAGHNGISFYHTRMDPCATNGIAAGSVHRKSTFGAGHLFIDTIQGSRGGNANISLRMNGMTQEASGTGPDPPDYQAVDDPLVIAYNVALPTGILENEQYTIGQPTVLNQTLKYVTDINIAMNVQFDLVTENGKATPHLIDIRKIQPLVTITCEDVVTFYDPPISAGPPVRTMQHSVAVAHNDTNLTFVKRLPCGDFVDPTTKEHIIMWLHGKAHARTTINTTGDSVGTTVIEIACSYDDNLDQAPVLWDTEATYEPGARNYPIPP